VLIPLFSMPSTGSWGIGEIGDIVHLARWLRSAHVGLLQLLPLNEMAPGQSSPYSAISAMAIDPIFISVGAVPDFIAIGGEEHLSPDLRDALDAVRRSPTIDYRAVRLLKQASLRAAFEHFLRTEWDRPSRRAHAFLHYCRAQRAWLNDYALFRAFHAYSEHGWTRWDPPLARREPARLREATRQLKRDVLFYRYLQWIAEEQWQQARRDAEGLLLFGDLPFMVDEDSADVWTHQDQFRFDGTAGAPPDAFSETGQKWGLPVYWWERIEASGDGWLRARAQRSAALYDGFRVDHVVGFYRTWVFPRDGSAPYFTPSEEWRQIAQGERLMRRFAEPGCAVVAEDLGIIPDSVRASLAQLELPGYKVMRWEREWSQPRQPFRDPVDYAPTSLATSGTHDTEPLANWWDSIGREERQLVGEIPTLGRLLPADVDLGSSGYSPLIRDALLETLVSSGSDLAVLPVQDLFGWRDRINVPGTITDANWTYRLPWPSDTLALQPDARERADTLRNWVDRYGRNRG
jgi:4-alpha-glucanotransferase